MGASLNQPSRVKEEGPMGCKLLFQGVNNSDVSGDDGTLGISIG